MSATPQPRSEPARTGANASLTMCVVAGQRAGGEGRASAAGRRAGVSAPGEGVDADLGRRRSSGPSPARARAARDQRRRAASSPAPARPAGARSSGRGRRPAAGRRRPTRATSVFELPPSTPGRPTVRAAAPRLTRDGAAGTSSSASIGRTSRRHRAAAPTIAASASRVGVGQAWSRTTAPSPWPSVPSTDVALERRAPTRRVPVLDADVPADVPVAGGARARPARAGRPPRRRTGSGTRAAGRRRSAPRIAAARLGEVLGEPGVGQQRHPGMVVGVVADEMPAAAIDRATSGIRLGPAALEEERGRDTLGAASASSSRSVTPRSVGRSGCSTSKVSATRTGPSPLTSRRR